MVRIKKYPNRRLYDTSRSRYVNLEEIADLVRAGHEIEVVDEAGTDITRAILFQIVAEVLHGADLIPTGMLRRMIRSTGTDPWQRLLRTQVGTGLELLSGQLDRWEAAFAPPAPPAPAGPEPRPTVPDGEVEELSRRLRELEKRLGR